MKSMCRVFLLLIVGCVLFSSCTQLPADDAYVGTTTSAFVMSDLPNDNSSHFILKQGQPLSFSYAEGEEWSLDDGAFAFYRDSLFSETFSDQKTIYRRYDLLTKEWHPAGETESISLGVASSIVTEDNILFTSNAYEGKGGFSLMQMDFFSSDIQEKEHFDWMPAFQYLEMVDNQTFLVYGPKQLESGAFSYYINLYDISSGKMTALVEKPNSDIEGISCYDYSDGNIYAVQFVVGQMTEMLQVYTLDGVAQKNYDLSPVREYMEKSDAIKDIEVFGDYVMCWTLYGHRFVLMKMVGDKLIEVGTFNGDKVRLVQSIKGVGDFGLLFNQTEKFIVRYDTGEKCFVQHELDLLPHTSVKGCLVDEKGNILFYLSFEDGQGNNDVRYYLINFNNL